MEQYLMDDLNAMSIPELQDIAAEMGIKMKKSSAEDKQSLIFEIIDKQAENAGQASQEKPRARRSRISDTPTGSRVYTANSDGKAKSQAPAPAAEADGAASVAPRKRGRPSKAELQARAEKLEQLEVAPIFNNGTAPEEETEAAKASDNFDEDLPAFLTEELKKSSEAPESEETETKAEQTPVKTDSIKQELEATRGEEITDTDFVIVQDLPIVPVSSMPVFMDEPSPMQESVGRPKFRRFKDDPLLADGGVSVAGAPAATSASAQPQRAVPYVPQTLLKGSGVLELMPDGFGFLRSAEYNYLTLPDDIFVTPNHIRSLGLKVGDVVEGTVKIPREGEKYFTLVDVELVNGLTPAEIRDRVAFEHLTPLFPEEKFSLCSGRGDSLSRRIVDLFAPIGKGQRALIVAQPKTGKTMLMKDIANAIAQNHPDTYLMMLLIDERPEEVTDMARTVKAEVIASTFDEPAAHHVKIAGLVLEKAKRMVECGHDVVIFLDSITRLARAYNTVAPTSGKVLTGGVDANALQKPKRFFGAARNIEGGGSLTIIATALIDTGSKMDEVIFEEFKGTGNMELQLERVLSNKRIFPAVNLVASSTRRDDLLLDPQTVGRMHILRNYISEMNPLEAITDVRRRMEATRTNEEFIMSMNS